MCGKFWGKDRRTDRCTDDRISVREDRALGRAGKTPHSQWGMVDGADRLESRSAVVQNSHNNETRGLHTNIYLLNNIQDTSVQKVNKRFSKILY